MTFVGGGIGGRHLEAGRNDNKEQGRAGEVHGLSYTLRPCRQAPGVLRENGNLPPAVCKDLDSISPGHAACSWCKFGPVI